MRDFRKYDFWIDSVNFAKDIYLMTNTFPRYDALSGQIQRSAVSISSNIAEGSSRESEADFARFLEIALGSAYEAESQLEIARLISYIDEAKYQELRELLQSIERRIASFIKTLRKKS
jgi:four helix bundle protein